MEEKPIAPAHTTGCGRYTSPINPQPDCAFINRLPREVRDKIYLELWKSYGLRQHILWHEDAHHFCHWKCTTEYNVKDSLEEEIDATRINRGIYLNPLGPIGIRLPEFVRGEKLACRLRSPWLNHWPCEEHMVDTSGWTGNTRLAHVFAGKQCIKKYGGEWPQAPYLPMLQSCKIMRVHSLALATFEVWRLTYSAP